MITTDDLKRIVILSHLTDSMLVNLIHAIDVLKYDSQEIVFSENEPADRFFMMSRGKVLLNQRITRKVTACVGAIKPGHSFGWSSMIEGEFYTAEAVCVEPSEIYSFKREKILKLIDLDPAMGLHIYKRLLVILKKRYDYRTEQFKQSIVSHPDMEFACRFDDQDNGARS
jgi:CRP-like cAMP-binding protein